MMNLFLNPLHTSNCYCNANAVSNQETFLQDYLEFFFQLLQQASGRLLMISGATGALIGRPLEIPQSADTYMAPILHELSDGAQYIVFGSGGESLPGIYYGIE